jgi:hypothetical protein
MSLRIYGIASFFLQGGECVLIVPFFIGLEINQRISMRQKSLSRGFKATLGFREMWICC